MTSGESIYLLRALKDPWPDSDRRRDRVVDTTNAWFYGVSLNVLTTATYPGHDPDPVRFAFMWAGFPVLTDPRVSRDSVRVLV